MGLEGAECLLGSSAETLSATAQSLLCKIFFEPGNVTFFNPHGDTAASTDYRKNNSYLWFADANPSKLQDFPDSRWAAQML